jgi:hypothetical protein
MALLASARQRGHTAMWCDLADTVVTLVYHEDIPVPIQCDSPGSVELSSSPFSVLMALLAGARQSGHSALRCDLADTMVATVSHEDFPISIQCDSSGPVEPSNVGSFSVSMATLASARQSGHAALWCDIANTMALLVSHEDVPVPIHCDSK